MQTDTEQVEENYRLLTENSNDLIARLSIEGICLYVSPACESLLGYSPNELLGRQAFDFIHPMDKRGVAAAIEPEILFQFHKKVVCRLRRKDGFYGWFEATFRFFSAVETKALQVVVVMRDIGDRLRAERFEKVRHALTELRASDAPVESDLPDLLRIVCTTLQWEMGQIWLIADGEMALKQTCCWHIQSQSLTRLSEISSTVTLVPGVGLPGTVWSKREILLLDDIDSIHSLLLREQYHGARIRSAIGSPLMDGSQVYGVIIFFSRHQIQRNSGLLDMIAGAGYELGEYLTKKRAREDYKAEYEKRGARVLEEADRNRALQDEVNRRQHIEHDLALAAEIQRSLLPAAAPNLTSFELASAAFPARYISGDFYDFLAPQSSVLDIIIADVSGKGFASALMTSAARALFRSGIDAEKRPAEKLKAMNAALYPDCERTEMFLTAQTLRLDLEQGVATYASAGHTEALFWRHLEGKIVRLGSTSIPLGIVNDIEVGELELAFLPGDCLVIYSDGATEATNAREELFGTERLIDCVERMASHSASAQSLVSATVAKIRDFSGNQILADDLTMIALKAAPRRHTLRTKAAMEYLDLTAAFVRRAVSPCGARIADEVELITSELFTNIAIHSRADAKDSPVNICVGIEPEKIVLDFFYNDENFDPTSWAGSFPSPQEEGGRGIHIVKALVDVFRYTRGPQASVLQKLCGIEDESLSPAALNNLHIEKSLAAKTSLTAEPSKEDTHDP